MEVVTGERPATQLLRWTNEEVYDALSQQVMVFTGEAAMERQSRNRAVVRSVRICQPRRDIAEVCVLIDDGIRPRAGAFRLESTNGRWLCTALELG